MRIAPTQSPVRQYGIFRLDVDCDSAEALEAWSFQLNDNLNTNEIHDFQLIENADSRFNYTLRCFETTSCVASLKGLPPIAGCTMYMETQPGVW